MFHFRGLTQLAYFALAAQRSEEKIFVFKVLLDGKFILLISLLNFALLPCTEKSDDL